MGPSLGLLREPSGLSSAGWLEMGLWGCTSWLMSCDHEENNLELLGWHHMELVDKAGREMARNWAWLPWWLSGKEPACNAGASGDMCSVKKFPWGRVRKPTLVFSPGESHGQRSPAGYSPYGRKESDTTEETWQACMTLTQQFPCKVSPTRLDFFQFDEKGSCQFELALLLATERIPTDANLNHAKGSDS